MDLRASKTFQHIGLALFLFAVAAVTSRPVAAQRNQTLFGDVKIDEGNAADGPAPKVMVVLYKDAGGEVGRQPISNRSRYRFGNLVPGDYQLVIEVENNEIARMRIVIEGLSSSPYGFQHDLEFALKPGRSSTRPGTVSTADLYGRSSAHGSLFRKAQESADKKKYDQAVSFLKQIVEDDRLDFQAWTLLGTLYLVQEKPADAEQAYLAAIEAKPAFVGALLHLGKLRGSQKNFQGAIDPLTKAVAAQPTSGEANYLLGEAYIQLRMGSRAIPYLNDAAKLGYPDAHLRLAWLYNAAGLKDKAAIEYELFLKKKPDYADRKKLEDYINTNKKKD